MNNNNEYLLAEAANSNDIEEVKRLLEIGTDINISNNSDDVAPIISASKNGHIDLVKYLIKNGADINRSNLIGESALYVAGISGHKDIVNFLLNNGADPNVMTMTGPLLYQLAFQNNIELTELLLDHGANINIKGGEYPVPISLAIHDGNIEVLKLLLERGAKVNSASVLHAANIAAEKCDIDTIKTLLENSNWNPNPKKTKAKTSAGPLHYAVQNSCVELVKLLIKNNADVNLYATHSSKGTKYDVRDKKPLQLVKFLACPELVDILKDAGATK